MTHHLDQYYNFLIMDINLLEPHMYSHEVEIGHTTAHAASLVIPTIIFHSFHFKSQTFVDNNNCHSMNSPAINT